MRNFNPTVPEFSSLIYLAHPECKSGKWSDMAELLKRILTSFFGEHGQYSCSKFFECPVRFRSVLKTPVRSFTAYVTIRQLYILFAIITIHLALIRNYDWRHNIVNL
eukprot:sb/3477756/